MTEVFDESIQYQPQISNHPTPVYRTLTPQGSNNVNLSTTSVVGPVDIVVPPAVINYSKSRLSFLLTLPQPAQEPLGTNRLSWVNANLGNLFSRIALTDSLTGATICDVSNFDFYINLVSGAGTSVQDLLTKASGPATGGFRPVATSQLLPVEEIGKVQGVTVADNYIGSAALTNASFTQFNGKRQFYIGTITTNTDNSGVGDIYLQVSIPLSAFKMSFFSVDKNIYTPTNWNLSLYFNPISSFCFCATANNTAAGNTNYSFNAGAVVPLISGISLITCGEGNLALSSQIINKVMTQGLSMPFSYPTVSRFVASASSSHAVNLMLSRAYGSRILAIITAGYESVVNNTKIRRRDDWVQYNTFLNSIPILRAEGFNVLRGEDYTIANRHFLNDSAVQTSGEYAQSEYLHIDSWVGQIPLYEMDKKQTMVDGLDVSAQNSTWSLTGTTTTNRTFNWTSIVCGQKVINLSNQGATVI
jgi:hypothetical protein